jgi:hypothetical protein
MEPEDWIAAFAARLGVEPPDAATVEELLAIAAVAAHASARTAAPIACFLIGRARVDIDIARDTAEAVGQ